LPFADAKFDLCLCSHLLFLYSEQLTLEFHIASMLDQLRVAREVRVFPLFDLECRRSAHLDPVRRALDGHGIETELARVPHEFQKGANEMLRAWRRI
jgi:hypothetical protein